MGEIKTAIAIPTYKSWERVEQCLASIFTITEQPFRTPVVVLDDGTPDVETVNKLMQVCKTYGVDFIRNDQNRGIPYSWNRLTEHYKSLYTILFNDDITVTSQFWLKHIEYFLEHNEQVGSVGFPLIHMDPTTLSPAEPVRPETWGTRPGRVGAAVGCSFGFKKAHWAQISQIDGSTGFPEYFGSFHEESIAFDRFTVILNEKDEIEVVRFDKLFDRYAQLKVDSPDGWERIINPPIKVLSAKKPVATLRDSLTWQLSDWERDAMTAILNNPIGIFRFGARRVLEEAFAFRDKGATGQHIVNVINRIKSKLNAPAEVCHGSWDTVFSISRHRVTQPLIQIVQKYGETEVTENHSLMVQQSGQLHSVLPADVIQNNLVMARVVDIPSVKLIQSIDLSQWMLADDRVTILEDRIIYQPQGHPEQSICRYATTENGLLDAWCKLIGGFVSEGSVSPISFSERNNRQSYTCTLFCNTNPALIEKYFQVATQIFDRAVSLSDWIEPLPTAKATKAACFIRSGTFPALFLIKMCEPTLPDIYLSERDAVRQKKHRLGSRIKRLPNFVFHLADQHKKQVWEALLDGDGFTYQHTNVRQETSAGYDADYKVKYFDYWTSSLGLVSDITVLCAQLGLRVVHQYRQSSQSYSIRASTQYHNNKLTTRHSKREPTSNEWVYDLTVDGETSTFIDACGLILLHNTDFGMESAKRGWRSYQLHTPPMEHHRSRTFSLNPELAWWKFDDRWISRVEYQEWSSKCSHSVNFWGVGNGFMTADGRVDRMGLSRILFAKKWGTPQDQIDNPQVWVHEKYVNALEPIEVKWLNEKLEPCQGIIP